MLGFRHVKGSAARRGPTPRSLKALGLSALTAGLVIGVPKLALGAPTTDTYNSVANNAPDAEYKGRWGERIVTAGDLNGDGVKDVWIADPNATVGGNNLAGRVYAMDGKSLTTGTPKILYRLTSPNLQAGAKFGFYIANIRDIDGDGVPDLAVGTDGDKVGNKARQGRVYIYSGASGNLIRTIEAPDAQGGARFGSRLGYAGQLTGGGINYLVAGASGLNNPVGCVTSAPPCRVGQGRAYVINASTGAVFKTLDLPDADLATSPCSSGCGSFGIAVQGPGDTNSDGVPDILVDAATVGGIGSMYLFDGATVVSAASPVKTARLKIDDPEPQLGAFFGFQDVEPLAPGDVNGDGNADLYGNGFGQNQGTNTQQGAAWVFDSKTGAMLYKLKDPNPKPGGQFGWSMVKTDYNHDGVPDLYVGASPHHDPNATTEDGETNVFDGRNGNVLKQFPLPAAYRGQVPSDSNTGPNIGWTVAAPGDLNGDGAPDYLAGAPFTDIGANQDQGLVVAFVSVVQAVTISPTPTTSPTVAPTPGLPQAGFNGRASGGPSGVRIVALVVLIALGPGLASRFPPRRSAKRR